MKDDDIGTTSNDIDHSIVEEHDLCGPDWSRTNNGFPKPEPEFVCSVAEALEAADEVIINGRSRALTVLGFEEQTSKGVISGSDYPYHILWLRGNGTEYRLRWSHTCEYLPRIHTESELEVRESWSIKHGELTDETLSTGPGERVLWLCPVDVDEHQLSEWVFFRSVDGLNECNIDTDTDRS